MAQETESKLRLTAQDQTAAAFQSAARNIRQLHQDAERFGHQMPAFMRAAEGAMEHFNHAMTKWLSAAAIEEFTRHSFMSMAELERSLTRIAIGAGIPREKMQHLGEELERLAVKTGIATKDLREGFGIMLRDTRLAFEEVEHVFPLVADGAKVANVTT